MTRTVAEEITETLAEIGVEVVFGLPGVHNLSLFEALDRSPIRTVVVRHEATAAYAADAVGRLTGSPGVCLTTSGPGAANAVTGMGEAQASRSPMVHLTTTVARRHLGGASRGVLHEHPRQRRIFEPVSKSSRHVNSSRAVPGAIREAVQTAAASPQGPAYLEIPTDLLDQGASPAQPLPIRGQIDPHPPAEELRSLASFLAAAERPAIWVGSGGAASGGAVTTLAERLQAPIVLTHSAKRRWSASPHPLVLTHPPHEPAVARLLERSDAVLVLGSDLDGMMTQEFRLPLTGIARVDVAPERVGGVGPYVSARAIVGSTSTVVDALLDLLPRRDPGRGPEPAGEADQAARRTLEAEPEASAGLAFVDALDGALADRSATVVCDMAVSGYWTGGYLPLGGKRRVLYPLGWGTLGFAIPASVGAASVAGTESTVAVCGDGGSLMSIGELATLAQEQLDVTVVVHNDSSYGMLRYDEERRFGRSFAVELDSPDFVELARSFGVAGQRAGLDDGTLEDALTEALDSEGPSLIEVRGSLTPPRVTSARWPLAEVAGSESKPLSGRPH